MEPSMPIKNLCKYTEIYKTSWMSERTEGLKEGGEWRESLRLAFTPSISMTKALSTECGPDLQPWQGVREEVLRPKPPPFSQMHGSRLPFAACLPYYHADPMDAPEHYKATEQQSETQFHHSTGLKWLERWKAHCIYSDFTSGRSLLCNRLEIQAFEIDLLSVQQNES